MPWAQVCRDFAKHCGWTAEQVLEGQTFAQFLFVWCGPGGASPGHDPDAVRRKVNRRRAALGLPPMKDRR